MSDLTTLSEIHFERSTGGNDDSSYRGSVESQHGSDDEDDNPSKWLQMVIQDQ
jgi:hypothetical protein